MTAPEKQEIPEGYREERWVFLGEFEGQKYKRVGGFRTPSGKLNLYKYSADYGRLAIGYYYTILVNDDDSIRGGFKWTGDQAEDSNEIRMEARSRDMQREQKLIEERARKNDPDLDRLLEHVSEYAARFTKSTSRDALVAVLTRQVYRANRRS